MNYNLNVQDLTHVLVTYYRRVDSSKLFYICPQKGWFYKFHVKWDVYLLSVRIWCQVVDNKRTEKLVLKNWLMLYTSPFFQ